MFICVFFAKMFGSSKKSSTFASANQVVRPTTRAYFGVWCNGNTADSGPAFPGSSPGTPTKNQSLSKVIGFFVAYRRRPKNVRTRHLMLCTVRLSSWPMLVKLNTIERPANLLLHWRTTAPRPVMMTSGKW